MATIEINTNITLNTPSATTVVDRAKKNLLLMLKEEGRFIPSHEKWIEIHEKATSCEGAFSDRPISWAEEVALLDGHINIWRDIFLSRLDTPVLRSYAFWALEVIHGEEDWSGQKWPDRLEFFLPNYGEVASATKAEIWKKMDELEEYFF